MNNIELFDPLGLKLDKLDTFTSSEKELIYNKVKLIELDSGEFFLEQGDMSDKVGFVLQGILRYHVVNKEGKEITVHFHRENEFIADSNSFFGEIPSHGNIQAEMPCKVLILNRVDYFELGNVVPNWHKAICKFTNQFLMDRGEVQRGIINGRAIDSYKKLIHSYPEVAHNVPLGHIASYLGITQSTLSRVRKKMVSVSATN